MRVLVVVYTKSISQYQTSCSLQAVIYINLRVKDEEYTHEILCTELGYDPLQYANIEEPSKVSDKHPVHASAEGSFV